MPDNTPNLSMPYILPAQAQKHVTHNEALQIIDAVGQLCLEAIGQTAPPATAANGLVWAVGTAPTGQWFSHDNELAIRAGNGWIFVPPQEGWSAWDRSSASVRVWQDGAWETVPISNVPGIGIGTGYDDVNRLSVFSEATLLSHAGGGHQLKINKASAIDTASLLFQTGWSGRAEMGLAGDDGFAVKVSANGTAWSDAIKANPATGRVALSNGVTLPSGTAAAPSLSFDADADTGVFRPAADQLGLAVGGVSRAVVTATALQVSVPITGAAVVSSATDVAAGKLLTTNPGPAQAYRRGNVLGAVSQAAGVPTGGLIERGSNANGQFTRWADGTQICWQTLTVNAAITTGFLGGFRNAGQTWVYPAVFVTAPSLNGSSGSLSSMNVVTGSVGPIAASVWHTALTSQGTPADLVANMVAVGRWF
jgi:hypothetical protein